MLLALRLRCLRLVLPSFAFVAFAAANPVEITGPDGTVRFRVEADSAGRLTYAVGDKTRWLLEPARAGPIVNEVDLGDGVTLGSPSRREVAETFPWRGNKTQAKNRCTVFEIPVAPKSGNPAWTLEVRVFADGAAFRYKVPGEGTRRVSGEATTWRLPADATLWYQTDTVQYEGLYHSTRADQVPLEQEIKGRKLPVFIGPPFTAVFATGGYALITEASLYRYSGVSLRPLGAASFRATFEDDPKGWSHEGTIVSPWRVVVLSADLHGLADSDVIPALGEPPDPTLFPQGIRTDWIRPGKAPCTWMIFGNDGGNWERQKWFVDRSAAMGCEYLLVDGGWQTAQWGWLKDGGNLWERCAELCRYAESRGVGIFLWHAYPEGRKDGPGLTTPEARETFFARCAQAGVKGVKIDFFNSESRAVIDAYEDILRRAARHRLMVNFHGANKPSGEPRTWPNEVTREALREQEYNLWGAIPLEHYGALPFTRMATGHADFLPGYVRPHLLKNTSVAFQMASVVVFTSPFLCWPDHPDAYINSPLLGFVRNVPVTWDETRILPESKIGATVVMARRKADEWYIALLNCQGGEQELAVYLSPFGTAQHAVTHYRDTAAAAGYAVEADAPWPKEGRLVTTLRSGGGLLVHLAPRRDLGRWK